MARNHTANNVEQNFNSTHPMPVTCASCGFELPEDAEKNNGYFVSFLACYDKNRDNKIITGTPGQFVAFDNNGKVKGSSTAGYQLKENYTYAKWIIWCVRCHANKSRLQDMARKTNNLIPTGETKALSIESALKKLSAIQSMKRNSRP